jgi:hypothetical protein
MRHRMCRESARYGLSWTSGPPSTLQRFVMSVLISEFATLKPSYVLSWPPASPSHGQSMGSAPPGFEHASAPRRQAIERRLSPDQWMESVVTEETAWPLPLPLLHGRCAGAEGPLAHGVPVREDLQRR